MFILAIKILINQIFDAKSMFLNKNQSHIKVTLSRIQ